eukprot:Pgem_evm1s1534
MVKSIISFTVLGLILTASTSHASNIVNIEVKEDFDAISKNHYADMYNFDSFKRKSSKSTENMLTRLGFEYLSFSGMGENTVAKQKTNSLGALTRACAEQCSEGIPRSTITPIKVECIGFGVKFLKGSDKNECRLLPSDIYNKATREYDSARYDLPTMNEDFEPPHYGSDDNFQCIAYGVTGEGREMYYGYISEGDEYVTIKNFGCSPSIEQGMVCETYTKDIVAKNNGCKSGLTCQAGTDLENPDYDIEPNDIEPNTKYCEI